MTDAERLETYKRKVDYFARQATMWRKKVRDLENIIKRGADLSALEVWIIGLIRKRGPMNRKELKLHLVKSLSWPPADLSTSLTRLTGRGYLMVEYSGPHRGRYRKTPKCRAVRC